MAPRCSPPAPSPAPAASCGRTWPPWTRRARPSPGTRSPTAPSTRCAAAPAGDVIYAGGSFSHVDGTSQQKLAGIDAATGDVTGFHVNANNRVRSLAAAATCCTWRVRSTSSAADPHVGGGGPDLRRARSTPRGCPRRRAWSAPSCRAPTVSISRATSHTSVGRIAITWPPWTHRPGRRVRLRDGLAEVPHLRARDRRRRCSSRRWAGRAGACAHTVPTGRSRGRSPPTATCRRARTRTGSSTSAGTSRAWRTRPAPRWARRRGDRRLDGWARRDERIDLGDGRRSTAIHLGGPSRDRPGSRASGTRGSRSAKEGRARTGVRRGPRCRSGRR